MLIDAQTGIPIYNANEEATMRNERGVLRALPLSPEETAREQQTEAKRQAEINREKGRQSAWTHAKLETLAVRGAQKRKGKEKSPDEFQKPAGSLQNNLDTVGPILGENQERFKNALNFDTDLKTITNGFKNERLVIDGNEMQEMSIEGSKFLLGLLIQKYIFDQGFSITIGDNDQPILCDESKNPNTPARHTQMDGLQKTLANKEFSKNIGIPGIKNDNTSLLSEYIAANTYKKHNNLVAFRNELYGKIGVTNTPESPDEFKQNIENSYLSPAEKSFLMTWRDPHKDTVLQNIESSQEKFVKNAQENIHEKSPETHKKELLEHPFSKSAELLAGGAIGAALLFFAYKQIKKGGIWGTISGLIAGLIGGSIMIPLADKGWKSLGIGEALNNSVNEGKPIDRKEAKDNSFAKIDISIVGPLKEQWGRFQARHAGGQEGIEILMNKDVGQDIATKYPVYSMLNSLDSTSGTPSSIYAAPDETIPGTDIKSIKDSLEKLQKEPNQKAQLNTLLKDTWERYKKTEKYTTDGADKSKTTPLKDMLAVIEKEDGWFNTVIIDTISDEPEKKEALKVIGQNPKEWGKISLKDIKLYFLNIPKIPDNNWRTNHPTISPLISKIPDSTSILTNYFKTMEVELKKANEDKTLQNFLLGK